MYWLGVALVVAAVAAVILGILMAVVPLRVRFERTTQPLKDRWATLAALAGAFGVLAAVGGYLLSSSSAGVHTATSGSGSTLPKPTATGQFVTPQITPDDPVPTVPMHMTVYVTAHLQGDVLVIGNATTKNPVVAFQVSNATATNNTWSAYVTFGAKDNGGCTFNLWAVAMPQSLETYLLAEASINKPATQSYWEAPGLPPMPPATMLAHMTVRRSACQPHESCSC